MEKLSWFWDVIMMTGRSITEVGEIVGISRIAVGDWRRNDDVAVKHMLKVIEGCGYHIDIHFLRDAETSMPFRQVNASGAGDDGVKKNLTFLKMMLAQYNMSYKDLAKTMNVPIPTVHNWFREDTVKWSVVCNIAKACGFTIHIEIYSADRNDNRPGDGQVCTEYRFFRQRRMLVDTTTKTKKGRR